MWEEPSEVLERVVILLRMKEDWLWGLPESGCWPASKSLREFDTHFLPPPSTGGRGSGLSRHKKVSSNRLPESSVTRVLGRDARTRISAQPCQPPSHLQDCKALFKYMLPFGTQRTHVLFPRIHLVEVALNQARGWVGLGWVGSGKQVWGTV